MIVTTYTKQLPRLLVTASRQVAVFLKSWQTLNIAGLEREILARVCAEAIENDRQELIYESSPTDPLHEEVRGPACEGPEAAVTSRM